MDCHVTGAECYLLVNVTTTNTIKSMESGAYLEVRLPQELDAFHNECWATISNSLQSLVCQMVEESLIHVQVP